MIAVPLARREGPPVGLAVLAAALAVALLSAHDYAGSMNDGSRFAAAESLVDRHTFAIDGSVFVRVPPAVPGRPAPYPPTEPVFRGGTSDKVFINGHFYSDKGPVQCLLLAGLYRALQWTTGVTARERPDRFCYWLTVGSSGLAYALAVWCFYRLGRRLRLPLSRSLALAASLGLATMALPYVRNANNHVLLLTVAAALMWGLACLAEGPPRPGLVVGLGALVGLGYTFDLGAGPPLVLCASVLVAYRCRRVGPVALFVLGTLPWLALHHALNYAIGGTLTPYGAVPEYYRWPGSPWAGSNLTGVWSNHGPLGFVGYAVTMLVSKRGFLLHNLPLFLALPVLAWLLWRRVPEWPELLFAAAWSAGTWLVYALGSTCYGGGCCSVRWFLPLLAPGYYALAVGLRRRPELWGDFLLLSGWGAATGALMWYQGAWMEHSVALLWLVQALGLLHWALYRLRERRRARHAPATEPGPRRAAA